MDEQMQTKNGMSGVTVTLLILLTAVVFGGGAYAYVNNKATKEKNDLNAQITELQSQVTSLQTTRSSISPSASATSSASANSAKSLSSDSSQWSLFTSKSGWSSEYPHDWEISSCILCNDPTDAGVFVDFSPPKTDTTNMIMVQVLANKPSDETASQWYDQLKKFTPQPHLSEKNITVAGQSALEAVWAGTDPGVGVLVTNGTATYEISYLGMSSDINYSVFQHVLSSFKFL